MKRRIEEPVLRDVDEQRLAEELKQLVQHSGEAEQVAPSSTYWSNLIVRTNQRIDDATSGKAISISWAARVAIPGVVALLCFFIALHYYVPDSSGVRSSLTSVVASLPWEAIDSLLSEPSRFEASLAGGEITQEVLAPSNEQISEYLIASGTITNAFEIMSDEQVEEVLSRLGTQKVNL